MTTPKLLTAQEVADQLGLSLARVYELTRKDLIPHLILGERQYRYSQAQIDAWIENGCGKWPELPNSLKSM